MATEGLLAIWARGDFRLLAAGMVGFTKALLLRDQIIVT